MAHRTLTCLALATLALTLAVSPSMALEECRLLRQPDIQGDRIVFVYGGDLWTVARAGGVASRLTTHEGIERFPKFSPDGKTIAFTARVRRQRRRVHGAGRGRRARAAHLAPRQRHGGRVVPGRQVDPDPLAARASSMQRFDRFFRVPAAGGFEELLPLPHGGLRVVLPRRQRRSRSSPRPTTTAPGSATGAATPPRSGRTTSRRTCRRRSRTGTVRTSGRCGAAAPSTTPRTAAAGTANIWAYDLDKKQHRQVTKFADYDVKWPSIGGDAIVFENGGYLYVMDLAAREGGEDLRPGPRRQAGDARRVPQRRGAGSAPRTSRPSAKRAVIEARGDLFTVPAEKGDVRNLTQHPRRARARPRVVARRQVDRLPLRPVAASTRSTSSAPTARRPTGRSRRAAATFRYAPRWSPDSKKLAFSDKTDDGLVVRRRDREADPGGQGRRRRDLRLRVGARLALARLLQAERRRLQPADALLDSTTARRPRCRTGMTDDSGPAFDPEGKYLYFVSRRTLNPEFGGFELNFHFSRHRQDLRRCRCSDRRGVARRARERRGDRRGEEGRRGQGRRTATRGDGDKKDDAAAKSGDTKKDEKAGDTKDKKSRRSRSRSSWRGSSPRQAELPVPAGRYGQLSVFKDKVVFVELGPPNLDDDGPGGGPPPNASIAYFDLEKREDKTILSGVAPGYAISKDGGKLLYRSKDDVRHRRRDGRQEVRRREDRGRHADGDRGSAPRVDADVQRGVAARARLLLRPGAWAASTGRPSASATASSFPTSRTAPTSTTSSAS